MVIAAVAVLWLSGELGNGGADGAERIELRSGLSLIPPGGGAADVVGFEDPEEAGGLSERAVVHALEIPDAEGAAFYSIGDTERSGVLRSTLSFYERLAVSDDGTVDVRWKKRDDMPSSLAVVTRLPGHDVGLVSVFWVEGVSSRGEAYRLIADLWRDLSVGGAQLPPMDDDK